MEQSFIAVDIETTGLSPKKDKIIEIGAVKVVDKKVVATFQRLINPHMKLPEQIIELTHITDDMLKNQPDIKEVMVEFLAFANEDILLGHNILFDYSFLKTEAIKAGFEFERNGIDTLRIARTLHDTLKSRSLAAMCHYYGIENKHMHRAYDDAKAAMQLYFAMCKEEIEERLLLAQGLFYKPKKIEPITIKQKNYLLDLMKYHKIESNQSIEGLTRSEASRMIDKIILERGKIR